MAAKKRAARRPAAGPAAAKQASAARSADAPRQRYIVGIDLGGTNIVSGVLSEDGAQVLGVRTQPTLAEGGAETVVDRMVALIEGSIAAFRSAASAGS